ncbi:MAG TPA: thiamine pyrophosphate-dependent enzyme [Acidimicrobiales bacterium]|nr:thiamine pyrophosphate-dependent enzyme [Acidimicrobiales bacterium]
MAEKTQALDDAGLVAMFETMALIAATDDALRAAISAGSATLAYYSPRGQEAVAAGCAAALRPDDYLVTTYRGLHDQIAKGVPLRPLLAEMLGKAEGTGHGKGGPMHVSWPDVGLMLTTGVVGSGLPIAAGLAWAAARQGAGRVTVASFGDGATNIGAFHEAANLAAVWGLPVIFLCQNNGYGEHTAFADHLRVDHVAQRAAAYGMPGVTVDGNDPAAVYDAVSTAAARARAGEGPTLVEAQTYRLFGHVFGDRMTYVDPAELEEAWKREPLARFRHVLVARGALSDSDADALEARGVTVAATTLAEVLGLGELGADEVLTDVVGPKATAPKGRAKAAVKGAAVTGPVPGGSVEMSVRSAITLALDEALASDPRVVLLGEDISDNGVFGVTKGLAAKHGADRVRDTPISEQAIVGAAVGAALGGLRPVAEIMFMDFLGICLDQLANHAAKLRYMSGGLTPVPMVLRTAVGGGLQVGAQHSQMLEAWLTHVPGLKVVVPSTPSDARGLLAACIADEDPCVFIEQVLLLSRKGPVDGTPIELGVADIKRPGSDVTVVTYGRQVHDAVAVADALASKGVEVEVLDLRSLVPLDEAAVLESVGRTRRAVILHEAVVTGGFGAELAAGISEALFGRLVAPVLRVGALPAPLPYAKELERLALPGPERLLEALEWVMAYES